MNEELSEQEKLHQAADQDFRNARYEEAFEKYSTLARKGVVSCQTFLGWMYSTGRGVEQDLWKARCWLERAAENNDPIAMFELGMLYSRNGDYVTAFQYFDASAQWEYLPAIYRLAVRCEDGKGTKTDKQKAYDLFRQAAKQGHLRSQRTYARRLIFGSEGFSGVFRGLTMLLKFITSAVRIGTRDITDERFRY